MNRQEGTPLHSPYYGCGFLPLANFLFDYRLEKKKKKGNLGYSFCLVVGTEGNEQKMKLFYFSFLIVLIIKRMEFFFVLLLKEIG